MIRLFTILFKMDIDKFPTAISLFKAIYKSFNIFGEYCPECNAKGRLSFHDKYFHNLTDYINNTIQDNCVEILRVCCSSCGHTSAVLPDIFVPHKSYSILFILKVLKAYYLRKETVEAVCLRYGISVSTLYVWKKRYLTHKSIYLGKLAKYFHKEDPHMSEPCNICFTSFLYDFFDRFGFSFLQFSKSAEASSP